MSGNITLDEAARLEAALERIARASIERRMDAAIEARPASGAAPDPLEAEIAARLDKLILELRDVLGLTELRDALGHTS